MANLSDFLPAAGGGGGGIPKYQEFTASGTFTPSQALIDAGGRLAYFIVGGGAQGATAGYYGGGGGSIEHGFMTLNSTNSCTVTIGGAGGAGANGGSSSVIFSSAGGIDITANGAYVQYGSYYQTRNSLSPNHGGTASNYTFESGAGIGIMGYGMGGLHSNNNFGGGVTQARANSGQGTPNGQTAAGGFIRLTWFE